MCNKEHLVGYLYDELSEADRTAFEAHVSGCPECRDELRTMRQTRQHLATWSPPEPAFNLSVVRSPRPTAIPRRSWLSAAPRWGLAAAAALIVAAGAAAIANLEIRYEQNGALVVRTGWARPTPGTPATEELSRDATARAADRGAVPDVVKTDLVALQRRLDSLDHALQELQTNTGVTAAARSGISPAELRKILAESEARQRTEMAVHTAQIWKDFMTARANDWTRMQQAVVQAQGVTNRQLQQQRETIDSLRYMQTVLNQK